MKKRHIPGYILFIWLLFTILVLKLYLIQEANGQVIKEPWERTKQILIISAWTTLDAVSDAYIADNMNNVMAHSLDAMGTGLVITLPFTTKLKFNDAPRFLSSTLLIRAGMFDMVYNKTRGLPVLGYRTNVSYWDRSLSAINPPPSAEGIYRGFFITFGVVINLTGDYQ